MVSNDGRERGVASHIGHFGGTAPWSCRILEERNKTHIVTPGVVSPGTTTIMGK